MREEPGATTRHGKEWQYAQHVENEEICFPSAFSGTGDSQETPKKYLRILLAIAQWFKQDPRQISSPFRMSDKYGRTEMNEIMKDGGAGTCASVGQEASTVDVVRALGDDDRILIKHRSASHLHAARMPDACWLK